MGTVYRDCIYKESKERNQVNIKQRNYTEIDNLIIFNTIMPCFLDFELQIYFKHFSGEKVKYLPFAQRKLYSAKGCLMPKKFHWKELFYNFKTGKYKPMKSSSFYANLLNTFRINLLNGALFL